MDEETALIDANTRNEKIKNFLVNNKSKILTIVISIVVFLLLFFGYGEYKKRDRISVSDKFNSLTIGYNKKNNGRQEEQSIFETTSKGFRSVNSQFHAIHHPMSEKVNATLVRSSISNV